MLVYSSNKYENLNIIINSLKYNIYGILYGHCLLYYSTIHCNITIKLVIYVCQLSAGRGPAPGKVEWGQGRPAGMTKSTPTSSPQPRILKLAKALESDIRRRGLGPGDAYLSTLDAAQMLGVSMNAANSALRLLTKRGVIKRKQRSGAVIAHPPSVDPAETFHRVHIVVNQWYVKHEGLYSDGLTVGLQGVVPDAEIQFNYLPEHRDEAHVRRLVEAAQSSPYSVGLVISKASLAVQRLVLSSGLPSVVHGGTHPSNAMLPSIDRDNKQAGRIAMEHLVAKACRRVIILNRDRFHPGDHDMVDSVMEAADAAGIPASGIVLRALLPDDDAVMSEVKLLMEASEVPTGIIAQTERHARYATFAVGSMGLRAGDDVPIIALTLFRHGNESPPPFAYIRWKLTAEQQGELIGRTLLRIAKGDVLHAEHIRVPVELVPGP